MVSEVQIRNHRRGRREWCRAPDTISIKQIDDNTFSSELKKN